MKGSCFSRLSGQSLALNDEIHPGTVNEQGTKRSSVLHLSAHAWIQGVPGTVCKAFAV